MLIFQGCYDSGKTWKTWKNNFTEGKFSILSDLRENSGKNFDFCLISGKTQGNIFVASKINSEDTLIEEDTLIGKFS